MNRREFLKRFGIITASAGLTYLSHKLKPILHAQETPFPDMVAIKNGEPDIMFDMAMKEFGTIRRFVKPNQVVVIKPNIGWSVEPERGANTNPILIKQIVKHCIDAGAKKVYVFDHTSNSEAQAYSLSGIGKAVKDAGGFMGNAASESYYHEKRIGNVEYMKKVKIHELVLESDVFINVPVLKNHGSARVTIAMKNLMGVVYDRSFYHYNNLHKCIAEFCLYRKPDLTIIDAYRVMKKNGPRGVSAADVVLMKSMLIGTDMVALDTAAAKIYGIDPATVNYITIAEKLGIGTMNLDSLAIKKIVL